jgi:hypothetical protein
MTLRCLASLAILASAAIAAPAQEGPLRLEGLVPQGGSNTVTEGWSTLEFTIENRSDTARDVRVIAFYRDRRDVQFGRDYWVPARSRISTWLPIGPAPHHDSDLRRDIGYMLFDRSGGEWRPLSPTEPEKIPSRAVRYRKREPTTAIMVDPATGGNIDADPFASPRSEQSQSLLLARVFRHARGLSEHVSLILDRELPPTPETLDGVDHLVLAGNRLASDPAGRQAIRHWVLRGGTLWVLLDRVEPDAVAPILGDALRFQVVDRTSLTRIGLRGMLDDPASVVPRSYEQPVEFVRVLLSGSETTHFDVDGWPAAFSQPLGRGRVVFTTLGGRAWYRDRTARDPVSRFEHHGELPVPLEPLEILAWHIAPESQSAEFRVEELAPLLTAEIGYEVLGRKTAAAILIGFILTLLFLGLWLRRSRSPEWIGLLGPAVAVAAAGIFLVAGFASRRSVPSTAAAASVVEFAPETGEAVARGLFAIYSPESGTTELGTDRGGEVELDESGLEGQTRRRIQTDVDAWHWENLSFPAGVRIGPFRTTIRARASAVGRFGPAGLEGRLDAGPFRNPSDAVLLTRSGVALVPSLDSSETFRVGPESSLPPGQYLAGAVLTDRQQRRQEIYRKFLAKPRPSHLEGRDLLLVWTDSGEVPFESGSPERLFSNSLLVVPVELDRPTRADTVTIPAGFCSFTAMNMGRSHRPTLEGTNALRNYLRFQLPPSVIPFEPERATLFARVHAPGRKFLVSNADGKLLYETLNPLESVRIDITDPQALQIDPAGGLFLEIAVSGQIGPDGKEKPSRLSDADVKWQIEELGLELRGRVRGQ